MGNWYGYMRISTKEDRGKQKFSRQEKAMETFQQTNGVEFLLDPFKDDASGKSFVGRRQWERLEKLVQPGDTIVFKDITRFTREAENGYKKYMELFSKGINLLFIDNPTLSTDYIKNLMATAESMNFLEKTVNEMLVKVLLAAELTRAEQERLLIGKRIAEGMKASHNKAGRKEGKPDKLTEELKADITLFLADRTVKGVDIMKKHKISRNTFNKYCEIVKQEM